MNSNNDIIIKAIYFVKDELKHNDASHDWLHIQRVWNNAKKITAEEKKRGINVDEEVVDLAAILHDIQDWKYSGSETAGKEAARKFLTECNYNSDKITLIERIMDGVSFHSELKGAQDIFPELAIVQDADRLDAIGAIGISRCMVYSGKKNRPIYDPQLPPIEINSKEDYSKSNAGATSINHFYEKLFKIKSMMKTASGKEIAEKRHEYMVEFVDQLMGEWEGKK
jgi:uncharacterized protein